MYTLGCKLNQLEGEAIADSFKKEGFEVLPWDRRIDGPGIFIINTCTVTSKADQKARRVIRKTLRDNPQSCVIVTGCYARLNRQDIESLEDESAEDGPAFAGRRAFVRRLFVSGGFAFPEKRGTAGEEKSALLALPGYIKKAMEEKPESVLPEILESWQSNFQQGNFQQNVFQQQNSTFSYKPREFTFHSRGYLKIQDGCNNHCTYCRARLARGAAVSLPPEAALAELLALESKGCAEAMLTGVNITQYSHSTAGLAWLLEYLLANTKTIALRLSSLEPEGITEKFVSALAHPRIRPHFHLSVQSGSDAVLQRMGRVYDSQTVEKCAGLLRAAKDNPFLACDIITGFPGETEAEFAKTLALCEKIGFAWIHAFPFSKRPGTAAFSFTDTVCERDLTQRVEVLTKLAMRNRRDYARSWIGKELAAVVEKGKTGRARLTALSRLTGEAGQCRQQCRAVSENYLKLLVNYSGTPPAPGSSIRCIPVSLCEAAASEDVVAKM
jgi:threonylcarbamoyladenosine tRNA methylthiotransferase MtaB